MKFATVILLTLCLAGTAMATDLGNRMPTDKPAPQVYEPPAEPPRQGGDTIALAVVIPGLPFNATGTTAGFINNYDEICPYSSSTSPDVVYAYTPTSDETLDIDLCGSSYDTKLYVYDQDLALVACNDDFYFEDPCGIYVSRLECVDVMAGITYYIVVDGYGGDSGNYVIDIEYYVACDVVCPPGAILEGEPPLVPGYVDNYNGGCGSAGYPFQEILADAAGNATFCGVAGWYTSGGGLSYRDTDWFVIGMGPAGVINIDIDADFAIYLYELGPQDCNTVGVLQSVIGGPCLPASMTITGYLPQDPVWIWVGSPEFTQNPCSQNNEFDYVMTISGASAIPNEQTTWGGVKSMYR